MLSFFISHCRDDRPYATIVLTTRNGTKQMQQFFKDFFSNVPLMAALCAWLAAQVLKAVFYTIINRKFEPERLVGDGGFPSGHSATVTALCMACLLQYGASSSEFALSFILAVIVMHDARGVRWETGKQAKVINDIVAFFESAGSDLTSEEKLKELVGHSPLQVFAGMVIGALTAILFCRSAVR